MHPKWFALVLICVLSWVYLGSVANLQWSTHDREYIRDSIALASDPSQFFAADKLMPGRPTLELVLWGWFAVWGDSALAFHLLGIFLHVLCSWLLFVVVRSFGFTYGAALLASVFFLIHVGHFRAIHWVSAFCYSIVLLCALASMLLLRHYEGGKRHEALAALYAVGLLGMGPTFQPRLSGPCPWAGFGSSAEGGLGNWSK